MNKDIDLSMANSYLEKKKLAMPFYKAKTNVLKEIYSEILPTTVGLNKGKITLYHIGFTNCGSEILRRQIGNLIQEYLAGGKM